MRRATGSRTVIARFAFLARIAYNSTALCMTARGCGTTACADGRDMLEKFNIPSATHIRRETDLATLPNVTVDAREFSGSVSRKPVQLARACRRLQNAF
ncbi:hypothetical protein AT395_16880 [Pandoraea apista]|nr:hypothetical protein AT395_16880 [Pandoraea apista]